MSLFVTPWTVAPRLLCPWDSPGKKSGVGCHFLLHTSTVAQVKCRGTVVGSHPPVWTSGWGATLSTLLVFASFAIMALTPSLGFVFYSLPNRTWSMTSLQAQWGQDLAWSLCSLNICWLNTESSVPSCGPEDKGVWFLTGNTTVLRMPFLGLPWWLSGKESACQCRIHRFNPWSGKIPHAVEQLSPCSMPTCHNYRSPGTLEPSAAREAIAGRNPHTATGE